MVSLLWVVVSIENPSLNGDANASDVGEDVEEGEMGDTMEGGGAQRVQEGVVMVFMV